MTEFQEDVLYFTELITYRNLTSLSIRLSPLGFYEIDTGEEIFRYDLTEKRIFQKRLDKSVKM